MLCAHHKLRTLHGFMLLFLGSCKASWFYVWFIVTHNLQVVTLLPRKYLGLFLFGVKKNDFKKAMNANYLVSAKFRKKIIPNLYLRWGVIILVISIIILAIIGSLIKT